MKLEELRKKYKLIDLFVHLCEIPSPSLGEAELAEKIMVIFKENNIFAEYDDYKNVIARIPGTGSPILLSAHMDVVGDSKPVNIRLSEDGKYIETDKTRTLGSDNKAGVAAIIDLAISLENIDHGPIEITFTRDEEKGMSGIRNLDTSKLQSKYAIIADGGHLGELDIEGAGFTNIHIKVHGGKGGHSGINIHETDRISAIKVLAEVMSQIPQGVYKSDSKGTITSINAGLCTGGEVETGFLNVIASNAEVSYSLRSSEPDNEQELLGKIQKIIQEINSKYNGLINIDMEVEPHLMPFVRSNDDFLPSIIVQAAQKLNIKCCPASFHAGAETHVLANEKKNSNNEQFSPVIVGLADLENIHSSDEKIDWESFLRGRQWLEEIVVRFYNTH
ncbi:MAG: hypothetical protein A2Y25_06725 [Candidatus Melainabacteria bacterium GWF2_37_15]|nr:MAG: hypothetical protein A2Y25_06725 [Candidatus Melainabacteria bacterium GWF2_37_15]